MKLYYSPGACSVGIHVLLEEIGAPYEAVLVNLKEGAQFKPEFAGLNPKSKVPALERDDGSILTEYPAIAFWLASRFPTAGLMPSGMDAQARALECTDYCVATMHMQASPACSARRISPLPRRCSMCRSGGMRGWARTCRPMSRRISRG